MISQGINSPIEVLKSVFGYTSFRGEQEAVIQHVLAGKSGLCLMPTGSGKSLTYQLPACILAPEKSGNLVLVISPLIALMQDQVTAARKLGIQCDYISSTLRADERERRYKRLSRGDYQLLYVTPERFRKPEFRSAINNIKVALLAVDEAHCISLWGHDFRPDYSKIGEIRESLGNPPVLALTATATEKVQHDILIQLRVKDAHVFYGGLERTNLALYVHDLYGMDQKIEKLIELRKRIQGPVIVYFSLIGTLENFAAELRKIGIQYLKYHGQMNAEQRKDNQKNFLASEDAILLATPAFGLGINKPNIRAVIHAEMPSSLESYFQEIGRAGRDGLASEAHLLFDDDDVTIQMDFIKWSLPEPSFLASVHRLMQNNPERFRQEGPDFLRQQMNFYNSRDFRVETALNQLERAGLLESEDNGKSYTISGEWKAELFPDRTHAEQLKAQQMKLLQMVQWVRNTETCRLNAIYTYFGQQGERKPCGLCDNCSGVVQ